MKADNNISQLKQIYGQRKAEIIKRLGDFKKIWSKDDKKIFSELCFCILTPQSKAEACDKIINKLAGNRLLFSGSINKICPHVKKARFYKNKSRYIVEARRFFQNNGKIKIKNRLNTDDIKATRVWLVENIKGIGYKESSHFLRNIGFGEDLAILDVHILRNLNKFGVLEDIPKSLTKKRYLDIEEKFRKFSNRVRIPMAHLDLVFWSMGTGKIFK